MPANPTRPSKPIAVTVLGSGTVEDGLEAGVEESWNHGVAVVAELPYVLPPSGEYARPRYCASDVSVTDPVTKPHAALVVSELIPIAYVVFADNSHDPVALEVRSHV